MGVNDHVALEQTKPARLEGETQRKAQEQPTLATIWCDSQKDWNGEMQERPNIASVLQAGIWSALSPANTALPSRWTNCKKSSMKWTLNIGTHGNHRLTKDLGEFNRIMKLTPGQFNKIVDGITHEASKQKSSLPTWLTKIPIKSPFDWKPYTIKEIPVNDKTVKVGFIGVDATEFPNLVLRKSWTIPCLDEKQNRLLNMRVIKWQGVRMLSLWQRCCH